MDNAASVDRWISAQREAVVEHLDRIECRHRGVSPTPSFCVAPYVAIWSIESLSMPGTRGWWAISGDLPTDCIPADGCSDQRAAMRAFAAHWHHDSERMLRDENPPGRRVGCPEQRRRIATFMRRRAHLLEKWSRDDSMWE